MTEKENANNYDFDLINKISLENFDSTKKKIRITSPHSILACELMGIKMEDLAFLTFEEYLQMNPEFQSINKNLTKERYDHHNYRREKLITSLKEKRNELIIKENDTNSKIRNYNNINSYHNRLIRNESYYNFNKTFITLKKTNLKKNASMDNINEPNKSTMIVNEEERLKKIRQRQKINIRMKIDYQFMQEQIRIKNQEKMKLQNENEKMMKLKKQEELIQRKMKGEKKEYEQKKRLENFKKMLEERRQEKINKEKIKMLNEQKRREEGERKRKIKFEEKEKKEKEIRDRILGNNKLFLQELLKKQNELNELERKRQILIEQKKEEKSRQISEKTKVLQNKISYVLCENEKIKEEKKILYYQKQKKIQEMKKQKEIERNLEQVKQLSENQKRLENIKKVLKRNKEKDSISCENCSLASISARSGFIFFSTNSRLIVRTFCSNSLMA